MIMSSVMTYLQERPEPSERPSRPFGVRVPFMAAFAGGMASLAIALGGLNSVLEDWVTSKSGLGAIEHVEFVSGEIIQD